MVKTVSIADYQAARSLDEQDEREPYESIAEQEAAEARGEFDDDDEEDDDAEVVI